MKRGFLFFTLLLTLAVPAVAAADCDGAVCLNLNYPIFGGVDLSTESGQNLDQLVGWAYYFIVGISGFAAAGNPSATTDARDKMQKALFGLLLVLASFLILQAINPELTVLRVPGQ